MSGRPRSEPASEEASAMPQESVRQIQLKESLRFMFKCQHHKKRSWQAPASLRFIIRIN